MFMKNPDSHISHDQKELKTLFLKACTLQEAGKCHDALYIYKNLLADIPQSALLHFNCGLAHFELNNFQKAESHYEQAIRTSPDDPDIHYNRGLNYRRLLRFEDAIVSFEKAFSCGDTSIDTLYNLALSHQDFEAYSEAARLYSIILSRDPSHQPSLNNFAYLCHKRGETKKAEELYARLLQLNPHHQAAQHMLSSLKGATPDSAPLEYVEAIFDNYASTFESSLVEKLLYTTPQILYDFYRTYTQDKARGKTCLDLGCGTGLAGEHFKQSCSRLVGVDVSQKMLDVAKQKNIYDSLVKNDIICFTQKHRQQYDLIVAADVFTYLGSLEDVFAACYSKVKHTGLLIFSVETVEEGHGNNASTAKKAYVLKQSGRFGHSVDYIRTLCHHTGWRLEDYTTTNLRKDKDEWIAGHLFILQR